MGKVLVEESNLTNIANAIRDKSSTTDKYKPSEMANAINQISGGDTSNEDGLIDGSGISYTNDRVISIRTYCFYSLTSLQSFSSKTVTSIKQNAFNGCSLLRTVDIPNLNNISEASLFKNCTSLKKIEFKKLDSTIGASCFYNCANMTYADIGSASSISGSAFQHCTNLETLIIRRTESVTTMGNINALAGTLIEASKGYVYVPDQYLEDYKVATNWSTYANQIKALSELEE
jgi:hypothetical protein